MRIFKKYISYRFHTASRSACSMLAGIGFIGLALTGCEREPLLHLHKVVLKIPWNCRRLTCN